MYGYQSKVFKQQTRLLFLLGHNIKQWCLIKRFTVQEQIICNCCHKRKRKDFFEVFLKLSTNTLFNNKILWKQILWK